MAYSVKLEQFEGPLDLLLHLIEKAKVDIKDIFISQITEQYLDYVSGIDEMDVETASEFLAMAATLLYIKSRMLLPVAKPDDEEEEDPEEALIRRLAEYKQYKEASQKMKQLAEEAGTVYFKLPEEFPFEPPEMEFEGATLLALQQAMLGILAEVDMRNAGESPLRPLVRAIAKDRVSMQEKMDIIIAKLQKGGKVQFKKLFEGAASKIEVIVTFMAVLELISINKIKVRQKKDFEDFEISSFV